MKGVLQKGDNYYIDYRVNGRRKRTTIGPNRKLAEAVLQKRKVEIAENKYLDIKKDQRVKFKDFAHTYMENHAKPNKRSWKTTDEKYLRNLIPVFGEKYLYEIDSMIIERYKAKRKEKVSTATVNRELALLKCMFNRAIDWNIAIENPMRKVRLFKENNWRTRYLEKEDIAKLLNNCSPRLRAIVVVALNTGMRKSEIQNLKWKDIVFQKGYLMLHHTKNGEKRFVPLNHVTREALIAVRKHPESSYVFCDESGNPYNFRKSFETALRKSGIFDFRFHDLRHTFASHLVMSGVDLNTVRELLGHRSVNMTLRYSHLSPDHKTRAVEILGNKMDTFWTLRPKLANEGETGSIVSHSESIGNEKFAGVAQR